MRAGNQSSASFSRPRLQSWKDTTASGKCKVRRAEELSLQCEVSSAVTMIVDKCSRLIRLFNQRWYSDAVTFGHSCFVLTAILISPTAPAGGCSSIFCREAPHCVLVEKACLKCRGGPEENWRPKRIRSRESIIWAIQAFGGLPQRIRA
jgi:hypothetical protein